jgi:hypothetical protein
VNSDDTHFPRTIYPSVLVGTAQLVAVALSVVILGFGKVAPLSG